MVVGIVRSKEREYEGGEEWGRETASDMTMAVNQYSTGEDEKSRRVNTCMCTTSERNIKHV